MADVIVKKAEPGFLRAVEEQYEVVTYKETADINGTTVKVPSQVVRVTLKQLDAEEARITARLAEIKELRVKIAEVSAAIVK